MNRRFISSILALAVITSTAVGCTQQTTNESKLKDGTYSVSENGFGGAIKVDVVIENDTIKAVNVLEHTETDGIGTKAIDELPAEFVKANSSEVDTISSATVTSEALIKAVDKALKEASGVVEEESTGEIKDGKYTTKAHGQESYVHVATSIFDGAITNVEVLTHHETVGIGTFAIERIPGQIVENQSIAVDTVSGATLTSNAIKTAVSEAIELAGGNVDNFSTPVKAEVVESEVVEDVDVVIMGAGTAGLISANKLAEQGFNVLVFEKMDIPGGAMSTTYSGVLSFGSDRELEYTRQTQEDIDAKFANYMEFYEKSVTPENALNEGFPYWSQVLKTSGEFVNWLDDAGVGFLTMNDHIGSTPYMAPGAYQGGVGYAMEYLAERAVKDGARIIYSTPVVDLIQDESGKITGVKAEGKDGTSWTVNADAVLLASGGFGGNQELIAEHYPEYADFKFNTTAGSGGDGLVLGQKYGAGIDSMGRELGAFMSTYDTKYELAFMHYSTPGIIVNVDGDNIGNHMSSNHKMLGQAKLDESNEDTFYYVIDEAARYSTKKSNYDGLSFNVSYEPIFETGQAVHYESLEAAAEQLNLPNLVESVEANNKAAMSGEPDEFGRKNAPYIDTTEGVYLLRVDPTFYLTTGGLSANLNGEILDTEGNVIPGLYGAGDVLGSLEEKDGLKYGYGFDSAMIFSYIVADEIMANIQR